MPTLHSTPHHALRRPWLIVALLLSHPESATAQVASACDPTSAVSHAVCAPDQGLALDAARPSRRFATYSDLVSLVRARVSVGLVLAPFRAGPLSRLRFDVEAVTRLRTPRGVTVIGRVGANVIGSGLSALHVSATVGYVARGQGPGRVMLGAELGYARRFQALYLGASAGATVDVWGSAGSGSLAPIVRLVLGHAFY
ncbi:MAG: hypothetical protein KC593_18080 [Myxococcales bacterium]|nr:hypothetical protein [Myxococcales bacterium]MCB9629170.1 hypothetical protein [Sandaracinaceae bacterium]